MEKVSKFFKGVKGELKRILRSMFSWGVGILLAVVIVVILLILRLLNEIGDQAYHARKWIDKQLEEAKKWAK